MWRRSPILFIKNSNPLVMAHRGDSANVPENTKIAFRDAAELDVDVIETDVHITADKKLVFFHDKKLERTTNGKGKITKKTLEELKSLDMGYKFDPEDEGNYPYRGKGLKIQTVPEILEKYPNMRFNMDIKDKVKDAPQHLANVLKTFKANKRVQVGSFHQKQINKFRKYSDAPTSAGPIETFKFWRTAKKWIKKHPNFMNQKNKALRKLDYTQQKIFGEELAYVSLTVPMGFPLSKFNPWIKFVTPEIIKFAHLVNIAVFVWTINEKEHMKTLLDWNVDGIFTDKPALMLSVLERIENQYNKEEKK